MKKQLFIASLLFIYSIGAHAQQVTAATPAVGTTSVIIRADTIQAVHELFRRHRTGGWVWIGVGTAFALRIVTVAASSNSDAASGTAAGTAVGVGVLGGVPAGIGIGKLERFSAMREAATLSAYEQTKTLPKNIRRRLKRKYFIN